MVYKEILDQMEMMDCQVCRGHQVKMDRQD
jgi:hypothetical protein